MGESRAVGKNYRAKCQKLCLKKHYLSFRNPRVLVSDNERQFDNTPFTKFCEQLGIRNHYSSPSHPQANKQAKVANRSLLKIIKTQLEGAKGTWPDELPSVLWAYRMTVRTPTRETPFKLLIR